MSDPMLIFESLYAEIERLKAELKHAEENLHKAGVRLGVLSVQLGNKDRLITELCDVADDYLNVDGSRKIFDAAKLIVAGGRLFLAIQRTREATNERC